MPALTLRSRQQLSGTLARASAGSGATGGGLVAGLAAEHAALPLHGDGCWDAGGSSCFPDSSLLWMGETSWSARGTGVAVHSCGMLAALSLIALKV